MFMITFSADEDIKKIHDISYNFGCKVEIHPFKKNEN